ncbi:MAG: hypothetical protein GY754_41070 [bacterium]|nr:hypothetical protein [bacterium]
MQSIARIAGIGAYVPGREITNDHVLDLLERSSAPYLEKEVLPAFMEKAKYKIEKAGNITRNWCDEYEYCTDIAFNASRIALEDAGISANELDLIIFTGMSKAFVEPATSHVLRHNLQALNANVIDTQDACTSFAKSIEIANALIQTGAYKKILIASGERSYDWADFTCKTPDELQWKLASCTIGDAAGAIVLEATDEPEYLEDSRHLNFFFNISDGDYNVCNIGLNHAVGDRYQLYSHSARLINIGHIKMKELMGDIFSNEEWKNCSFDNSLHHDVGNMVNGIISTIFDDLNVSIVDTFKPYYPECGNVASASFPLALFRAKEEGRLKRGNLCLFAVPAAGVQAGAMIFKY